MRATYDPRFEAKTRFLPIITIDDANDAVPLAKALHAGGIDAIEFTLRTPCALEAIARVAKEFPQMWTGAGTILCKEDFQQAHEAGAQFFVSPGFDEAIADWPLEHGKLWLAGIQTASEIMVARRHGFKHLKFFPAEAAGGTDTLKALAPVYPDVKFYPTGNITQALVASYLQLPCVGGVGGSWVAPKAMLQNKDWAGITALARSASAMA